MRRGESVAGRRPWLTVSLVLAAVAVVVFLAGNDVIALTFLVAAFLAVAAAKRAG